MINEDPRMPDLNQAVTLAIFRAERLAGVERERAFVEVSNLEEQIAGICPSGTLEGDVARRGAITAAVSSRDFLRASVLVDRYLAEAPQAPGLVDLRDDIFRAAYAGPEPRGH